MTKHRCDVLQKKVGELEAALGLHGYGKAAETIVALQAEIENMRPMLMKALAEVKKLRAEGVWLSELVDYWSNAAEGPE